MNAAVARVETRVTEEDRIARIESDVAEIKDDVKTLNIRLNELVVANAREFGAVRTELKDSISGVRVELKDSIGGVRVDIEKTRTEIQGIRTTIESAKFWIVGTGIGLAVTILGALHTLKLI